MMTILFFLIVALSVIVGVIYRVTSSFNLVRIKQISRSHRVIRALAFFSILLPGLVHAHGNVAIEEVGNINVNASGDWGFVRNLSR